MKALPQAIAALLLVLDISAAPAAPQIPSSVMPGRERDRFTDSPVERFMQPGPYQPSPVITPWTAPTCPQHKLRHSKSQAGRKSC